MSLCFFLYALAVIGELRNVVMFLITREHKPTCRGKVWLRGDWGRWGPRKQVRRPQRTNIAATTLSTLAFARKASGSTGGSV